MSLNKWAVGSGGAILVSLVDINGGDIDGDGSITLQDAILTLQAIIGLFPTGIFSSADINGDGTIGLPEAIYILDRLAHP